MPRKGRKRKTDSTGSSDVSANRRPDGRFGPANNANPSGNPHLKRLAAYQQAVKNAVSPAALEKVLSKIVKLAQGGDMLAAKVLLDRTLGKVRTSPRTDQLGQVELPAIAKSEDAVTATNEILKGLAEGRIDAETANRLASIVELARRTIETQELAQRVESIENHLTDNME